MIKSSVPTPYNEPIYSYAPGSLERSILQAKLAELKATQLDIPLIIGGKEIRTGDTREMRSPHKHSQLLGVYHQAGEAEVAQAVAAAAEAKASWAALPWDQRAAVFLKAADLLSGPWRATLNAATMLAQSKTVLQAEIDAACELIDFWRFNAHYYSDILSQQPDNSAETWNRMEYRPLEGFVFAITPFNFTAIAGNLNSAPALCGNVTVWKPSDSAVYSGYFVYKLLEAAGLPPGVINFIPGPAPAIADQLLADPNLGGVHFTGSTQVFRGIWAKIAANLDKMRSYPRIVGETGGKDFIFVHNSAEIDALVVAALRGAFEYQGQKCSAASRMYMPRSLWPAFEQKYVAEVAQIPMGDVEDFGNLMGAVIHRQSFDKAVRYIEHARASDSAEIITGGTYDDSIGFFVSPTTIVTTDPHYASMEEEIFAPILTIFVYDDDALDETLTLCDETSPYALTGAIFAQDRLVIYYLANRLRDSAGNFYINDKPTGAVVGQQAFGGARASGTNDKAGSALNLMRWISARSIKENLNPPTNWRYSSMG